MTAITASLITLVVARSPIVDGGSGLVRALCRHPVSGHTLFFPPVLNVAGACSLRHRHCRWTRLRRAIRIAIFENTSAERLAAIIEMLLKSGYVKECIYVPGITEADVNAAFAEQ